MKLDPKIPGWLTPESMYICVGGDKIDWRQKSSRIRYKLYPNFSISNMKSTFVIFSLHFINRSYSVNVSATNKNTFKHLFPSISVSSNVVNKLECLCISR